MESKDLQSGNGGQGESKIVKISKDEGRIECEIKHVVRVHAKDFQAFQNSFEEWARQWE